MAGPSSSPGPSTSSTTDEDVIKRRLLIDGDGVGDDRRLNMLLKTFRKWSEATNETPAESQATYERIMSQISVCEYSYTKSRLMAQTTELEAKRYEDLIKKLNEQIETAKKVLEKKKEEFEKAKIIRKNHAEYEVLARAIREQPDRKQTREKLLQLQMELKSLQEKSDKLSEQLELKRNQFHVMIASIHELGSMLEDEKKSEDQTSGTSDVDVFDDEDMEILSELKEDEDQIDKTDSSSGMTDSLMGVD